MIMEGNIVKKKIAGFISIVTVVPIIALFAVTLLFFKLKPQFSSVWWYIFTIFFLTILPLSAYPLQLVLPNYKDKGRDGQRKLAFILAIIGYVLGFILSFAFKSPIVVKKVFSAYVASGGVLALINKFIGIKASGHACGISGPITLLYHFLGTQALLYFLILPFVFWARISLNRHSFKELITGTAVGIISTIIALSLF